jgi:5-methylcytosine-specific restriction endonuclease McrA
VAKRGSWSELPSRERQALTAAVLKRDGYRCRLAYPDVCTTVATTADHTVSRKVAGDGLDNLVAACRPCNLKKGDPSKHDPESRGDRWW